MPDMFRGRVGTGGKLYFDETQPGQQTGTYTQKIGISTPQTVVIATILNDALNQGVILGPEGVARTDSNNDFRGNINKNYRFAVEDVFISRSLYEADKSATLNVYGETLTVIFLPNNWLPGDWCIVRRVGAGEVGWFALIGASVQLPPSRSGHNVLDEQHTDLFLRVIRNVDGKSAIWAVEGATAEREIEGFPQSIMAHLTIPAITQEARDFELSTLSILTTQTMPEPTQDALGTVEEPPAPPLE